MRNDSTKFVAVCVIIMIVVVGFFAFGQSSPNDVEDNFQTSNVTKLEITEEDYKKVVSASNFEEVKDNLEENNIEKELTVNYLSDINVTYYDLKTTRDAEKQFDKLSKYQDKLKSKVMIHEKVNNGIIFGCQLRNDRYKYTMQIEDKVIDLDFGAQNITKGVEIVKNLWNKS